jgi:hypothetical protein
MRQGGDPALRGAKEKPRHGGYRGFIGSEGGGTKTGEGKPRHCADYITPRSRRENEAFVTRARQLPTLGGLITNPLRGGNEGNGGSLAFMARLLLLAATVITIHETTTFTAYRDDT